MNRVVSIFQKYGLRKIRIRNKCLIVGQKGYHKRGTICQANRGDKSELTKNAISHAFDHDFHHSFEKMGVV